MAAEKTATVIETAASLPGEHTFLSAIVADLTNDSLKLVYADWLEEQGDARAAFVREFVAASRKLKRGLQLPDATPYPRSWTNILGVPLLEGILEADLVKAKDVVLRLARPMVTIATEPAEENTIQLGGSKLGGYPDLPKDWQWPMAQLEYLGGVKSAESYRLSFLGQIALSELTQTQVACSLPQDGCLSFFTYEQGLGTKVFYFATSQELVRWIIPPVDTGELFEIYPTCRLSMGESWDLPPYDALTETYSDNLKELHTLVGKDTWKRLSTVRDKCHPGHYGHHLMGYACHFRTSDVRPGPDWDYLLCLDSDNNLGWNWCDGEHLDIFVQEDDLRNGSFGRVYGYAS